MNTTERCVDFAEITQDMTLEGVHHFVVVIESTSPEINVLDEDLIVYITDNDSELSIRYIIPFHIITSCTSQLVLPKPFLI